MKKYDYIILGAGASGLMLAYRMAKDAFFDDKSILIIDKVQHKGNDRTWCYWENGEGEWDKLLHKSWSKIFFGSKAFSKTISISPFNYKMIKSERFYKALWEVIYTKPNISFKEASVQSFAALNDVVEVKTEKEEYVANKLFNSIPNQNVYESQNRYPVIQQHFVGWFIKTEVDSFDDSTATFMDFNVAQRGNTRFMYVLPLDKKTALFEYTLFSKELLSYAEYEAAIEAYLHKQGIVAYDIIEKEKGSIPMTSFVFSELNSKGILNIGTSGGWTKASTGYTFKKTSLKTKQLIGFLKHNNDLSQFSKKTKYWYYDLLFLDVLAKHNNEGASLFASMFKKAKTKTIFKFLDEESSLKEDLHIILSVPSKRFMQAFFKRLF